MESTAFHVPLDEPATYRIHLLGVVDRHLVERLGDLSVAYEHTDTDGDVSVLTGVLRDQAALIGVLVQLYNRGLCLLSLARTEPGEASA